MMRKRKEVLMPFADEMVRAIMSGRKTQTRRVLTPQPQPFVTRMSVSENGLISSHDESQNMTWNTFRVGDRIGVRESAKVRAARRRQDTACGGDIISIQYRADNCLLSVIEYPKRLKPISIGASLPNGVYREAVRTWLEVTDVRIERLNEISETDAIAEGLSVARDGRFLPGPCDYAPWAFRQLWESIYGEGSFDGRWVVVTEFKVVK